MSDLKVVEKIPLPVDEIIVSDLEHLLDQAKKGQIKSFAFSCIYIDECGDNYVNNYKFADDPCYRDSLLLVGLTREITQKVLQDHLRKFRENE